MNTYLCETEYIDFKNPHIMEKVKELREHSTDTLDYIKQAYLFVRDEISHTWDVKETIVSKKASDVLRNKTGICWTKSCLLAALLRANGIPAGISYQKLTRADEDASEGYIIHALNTVYIGELDRWIRLDARGNKENVHAEFSVGKERLAYHVRPELGEIDYRDNHPDLDRWLCKILEESNNILKVHTDFDMNEREVYSPGDMKSPDYECGIWVPICRPEKQEEDETAEIVSTMMITGIL